MLTQLWAGDLVTFVTAAMVIVYACVYVWLLYFIVWREELRCSSCDSYCTL